MILYPYERTNNDHFDPLCLGGEPVDKLEDANRINKQGQILFVLGFVLFQIIFWAVAMAEFLPE